MTCEEFRSQLLQVDNPDIDERPDLYLHYYSCPYCQKNPEVFVQCLDRLGDAPNSMFFLPSADPNSPFYALCDRPDQAFQMVRFSPGNSRNRLKHKAGPRERHSRFRPFE